MSQAVDHMLDLKQVRAALSASKTFVYARTRAGELGEIVHLSQGRMTRWRTSAVRAFVERQAGARV